MGLQYDFYHNPVPKGSNRKPRLHARVVTHGTMNTDEIARNIHERSTLTTGDVKAVLDLLGEVLFTELSYGRAIHFEGIGYFRLTLECPPVKTERDIRAESIKVRSVAFRPDRKLLARVRRIRLERVREKNKSTNYSEIEIDGLLTGHFMDNDHITRKDFQALCGLTKTTANRRLQKWVENKKLKIMGNHRSSVYVPVEGNYRR